jgi:hypothetical protein
MQPVQGEPLASGRWSAAASNATRLDRVNLPDIH